MERLPRIKARMRNAVEIIASRVKLKKGFFSVAMFRDDKPVLHSYSVQFGGGLLGLLTCCCQLFLALLAAFSLRPDYRRPGSDDARYSGHQSDDRKLHSISGGDHPGG
jgi:hypothetical protein